MKGLLATAVAVSLFTLAANAAGRQASAPGLASRFLIITQHRLGLVPPRLEIVGRDGHLIRLVARQAGQAALSPNHKLIAWAGKGGFHVENVPGGSTRLLKARCPAQKIDICGETFVWSPDSRRLLVIDRTGGLAVVSLSNGATRQIVAPRKHYNYTPIAWSGPAHEILFTAANNGGPDGIGCCSETLVIARPSGTARRTLYSATDAIHDAPAASWSPNGKWITFTTDGRGSPQDPRLAIVAAATGGTKRIPRFNGYTSQPVWAPDSSRFVVGSYAGPLQVLAPAGRRLRSFGQTGWVPIIWTRGGIYCWNGGETPRQLRVIPQGQRGGRPVFTLPPGQVILTVQPI